MSQSESELPATQPLTQEAESQQFSECTGPTQSQRPWGMLYPPHKTKLKWKKKNSVISLYDSVYNIGRNPKSDYVLDEEKLDSADVQQCSRTHFKIERRQCEKGGRIVYIEDLSTTGTYVSKTRIGKNKRWILSHNDTISIIQPNKKLFVFWDLEPAKDLPGIPTEICNNYIIKSDLGKGGFGSVYLAIKKRTQEQMALKIVELNSKNPFTEASVMYQINHLNIVHIFDVQTIDKKLYMFMEYMEGGDLARYIVERGPLREPVAKFICYQMLCGVIELHSRNIWHRDIKPLNVLLYSKDEYPWVKITDFGLSKMFDQKIDYAKVNTLCGTVAFSSPELLCVKLPRRLTKDYDERCDVWSLGVVFYLCISQTLPFERDENKTLVQKIVDGDYKFEPIDRWNSVSVYARVLISSMLRKYYFRRPKAIELQRSPWFQDKDLMERINAQAWNMQSCTKKFCECESSATTQNENEMPVAKKAKLS